MIDFEVTPNRADWLGVMGIARDLAAAGVGGFRNPEVEPTPGRFPCPISIRLPAPDACPVFAGRLIRGVKNGPSPQWLQDRLKAIGLRPINALVDVTNFVTYDRARPLHVYDAHKLAGDTIVARLGHPHEHLIALDGKTYEVTPDMCVIADGVGEGEPDGARPIGLGGVMGGMSTGCSEETTDVFIEAAWFDPIRTMRTGRATGIQSDAQYRFARGVDPRSHGPGHRAGHAADPGAVRRRAVGDHRRRRAAGRPRPDPLRPGLCRPARGPAHRPRGRPRRSWSASASRSTRTAPRSWSSPPSWRRDVEGKADLVEEVARIAGYDALPSTPLPEAPYAPGGVLTAAPGPRPRSRAGRWPRRATRRR